MSHYLPHRLKRLQQDVSDIRSRLPNNEAIHEAIQDLTIPASNITKYSRPFKPGPQRARRGGGRVHDRYWPSSLSLPKRAINYDLAESFMDHSTNPLSSDLYKIKFKHSAKQWPNGRFINYKEKQDKLDGNIIEINCNRTIPLISKRKRIQGIKPSITETTNTISLLPILDPIVQEEKKKQVDKQTSVYANLFGGGRIPRITSTTQNKKPESTNHHSIPSSAAVSLLDEA